MLHLVNVEDMSWLRVDETYLWLEERIVVEGELG